MTHRPPQDPHPPVADASTASSATTPTPVKISPRVLAENAEPKLVQIGGRARAAAAPTGAKPNASALADDVKAELEGKRGARFWRSLNELADSPGFRAMLQREFPRHAAEMGDGVDRRRFLQLSSASLALAGLTGCAKQPLEKIVPYVSQPEEIIPGKPLYYATTLVQGGFGIGQLAESHMGRPTKVAGNQDHPASLGGSSAQAQASILDLYDPDRVEAVRNLKQIRTWSALTEMLGQRMQALEALEGEGLRILAPTITSPTLTGLLGELSARAPRMRVHPWEPLRSDAAHSGAEAAFGRPLDVVYDFSQADVVLTIGSSVLTQGPGATRYARDYGRRRTVRDVAPEDATMNRHYALETMVTGTGAAADHRLALAPSQLDRFAMIVAAKLGVQGIAMPAGELDEKHAAWLDAAVGDLRAAGARALVVVGEEVSSEVHALAHAINQALGNVGTTVQYVEPLAIEPTNQLASLQALVDDMNAGIVDTLVILGGNPVYTAPVDLAFTEALAKVKVRIYLGTYDDETAEHCHWHVPESHDLESWGDARAYDGTISLMQPLIDPL
ncbi:MAG: TAT-variant-translocated molybdopterin oxidoreductase, partial [Acidobacteriota bacterium]